jgi:beta-catenin-like protein 1
MLKRMKLDSPPAANGEPSEPTTKRASRLVTVRDEEEDEAEQDFAPGGDADYFVEEDDEGGRFFGGGLTDEQKTILNIFDRAGGEGAQDEDVGELCRFSFSLRHGAQGSF